MKFADNVLSKNEMKALKGGYGSGNGTCTVEIKCSATKTISCSGQGASCKSSPANGVGCWVQCDNDPKVNC